MTRQALAQRRGLARRDGLGSLDLGMGFLFLLWFCFGDE